MRLKKEQFRSQLKIYGSPSYLMTLWLVQIDHVFSLPNVNKSESWKKEASTMYLEKFTFFIFEAIWSATYQFRECVSTFWFKSCNWRFLCCSFLFYVHRIQQSQVGRQILQLILVRYFSSRSDLTIFFRIMIPFGLYISFTSYEQPIRISNFCNEFLFTYFVSKYWQDKSFKSRPRYIHQKMPI